MFTTKRSRLRLLAVTAALAISTTAALSHTASADDARLPACPQVWAHGGYPTGDQPWERDQVRQPNNPTALADYRDTGAVGVESDLQLTRDGTKAVMWHNESTNALTGSKADINTLWWDTGADKLNGRTIEVGPYKGEVVYSLRQFLDAIHGLDMVPMIEIKPTAKQSLLHSDAEIQDAAWSEVLDPIAERVDRQEIILYTHDDALRPVMKERATAAGLTDVVSGGNGPVWPDTVAWEEPPPSWEGNEPAWQEAFDANPARMATSWPKEMYDWLHERCE